MNDWDVTRDDGGWNYSSTKDRSWTGRRRLGPKTWYYVNINSNQHNKAARWSARVVFNGLIFYVGTSHPSCKSVAEALRRADKALTVSMLDTALRFFYAQQRVRCMYRQVEDVWVPFVSWFGQPPLDQKILAEGEYLIVWLGHLQKVRKQRIHKHRSGFYGSSADAPEEGWIEWN